MNRKETLRGVAVGAGYFSRFQYEAWQSLDDVEIVAVCDRSVDKAEVIARDYEIPHVYGSDSYQEMLRAEAPDFVDIITPPETHLELCRIAVERGIDIICQKPLAPDLETTLQLANVIRSSDIRFMVHENWRWQPWYREIKAILEQDLIGEPYHCNVLTRLGDGWGEDAYLDRQPFFRDYPRLFIFETGVHFLDTFRYLFGEMESVYARTAKRNHVIKGEDSALLVCQAQTGVTAVLDANRYNETEAENPRFTFGKVRIDGSKGHLELLEDGQIRIKLLGKPSYKHEYPISMEGFAGNCVYAVQRHFVDAMLQNSPFESHLEDYLKSVQLVEEAYRSASTNTVVKLAEQKN